MPHAALLVVQDPTLPDQNNSLGVSMPHAALLVVQDQDRRAVQHRRCHVSMPHAALLVVQECEVDLIQYTTGSFNAARGFVGGARMDIHSDIFHALYVSMPHAALLVVQAHANSAMIGLSQWFQCRTRLCWWCKIHVL